jgi:phosphoribosyl-AMP cyclohydrolase
MPSKYPCLRRRDPLHADILSLPIRASANRRETLLVAGIPNFRDDEALLPAVVQDAATGRVLMVAHMNRAAWEATLAGGEAVYYSRSRGRLWKKGEQSGHVQLVEEAYIDCDADAILLKVKQVGGAACHEGYESCFFRRHSDGQWQIVDQRKFDPGEVYKS